MPLIAVVALLVIALGASVGWYLTRPSWNPIVEPYVAFVEEARGYQFEHPVDVRVENIADSMEQDFVSEVSSDVELDDYASPWSESYRLLGLYDPIIDLRTAQHETTKANAAAYYDPDEKAIVIPPGEVDLLLAETIVHELTHALQDQHGLLLGQYESADSWEMRRALIEGDANRIARQWYGQLSIADQRGYDALVEEQGFEPPVDDFLSTSFGAAYALGEPTVLLLVDNEGVDVLDELMRQPAMGSTERLVDVLGDSPTPSVIVSKEFDAPEELAGVDGNLGPVIWFQALAPHVGTEKAFDAILGYDADAFRAFGSSENSNTSCVRFTVWFDTPADADEFATITRTMGIPAVVSTGQAEVTADVCSPVGNPTAQTGDVLVPLIWSNYLAGYHLSTGVDRVHARCAAIAQAKTLATSYEVYPDWRSILAEADLYVEPCT